MADCTRARHIRRRRDQQMPVGAWPHREQDDHRHNATPRCRWIALTATQALAAAGQHPRTPR